MMHTSTHMPLQETAAPEPRAVQSLACTHTSCMAKGGPHLFNEVQQIGDALHVGIQLQLSHLVRTAGWVWDQKEGIWIRHGPHHLYTDLVGLWVLAASEGASQQLGA